MIFLSCGEPKIILASEKNNQKQTIEFWSSKSKHKGEWFKQINGRLTDENGKWLYIYHISTVCGCLTKTDYRERRISNYKAVDHSNYDFTLDSTDKFMLSKFAALPDIENYCSKQMLETTKGFIKLNK